ncbi:hypothetical protein CFN49_08555 [Lactiplantibacillus plantarum]|uniref:hypothetical protein n=1 Tax=Lactiplantibacillus plantarum TaxID=1590 RepID=UPI000DC7A5A8|nr:hypothetical protein [Lactiplantibacillus plantarum]AWY48295.1 hypothetical protein CFN49_08555 [Lactiplantibacillus plantarum]
MKKVVTGAAIVASLFILSGCGNSSKTSTQSSSHHKETATNVKKEKTITVNHSSIVTSDNSKFSVQGRTEENIGVFLLNKSGQVKDTVTSDSKGLFHFNEDNDDAKTVPYYLTIDDIDADTDPISNEPNKNNVNKLKVYKRIIVKPSSEAVNSYKSSSSSAMDSMVAANSSFDESVSKNNSSDSSSSAAKSTTRSIHYDKVDLETFATETDKYIGKNVETSGEVAYIQKNPDNTDIYYVVILPKDDHASSGYSYGTVTEINVDTFDETNINEGDNITVKGGALTSTIKLNGKTLKSDIVVDSVSVN